MTKQIFSGTGFKKILILWLFGAILFSVLLPSVQAQGGCPAETDPAPGVEHTVIEALPLTPYIAETSSTQLNQSFYESAVEFTFDPTASRIFLAGSPDGQSQLCADDLIQVTSADWAFRLDSRSTDRQRIVGTDPIDISYMFSAGDNRLTVELVDLAPGNYSASPLWLVIVESITPDIFITATDTPVPTPRPTAPSMPTITPEPRATATLRPTKTPQPALLLYPPPDIPTEANPPRWPIGMLMGFGGGTLALLWFFRRRRTKPVLPAGDSKVYRDSVFVETYRLASFRKPEVTLGQAGDINLADETLADYVAQFRAKRNEAGQIETIVEHLDPEDRNTVVYSEPLHHGDQLQFGAFTLHYANYAQETALIVKGEYYHV